MIFLGNSRSYHTMDWFRCAQSISSPLLITDLLEGESYEKLVAPTDKLEYLFLLDQFLFKKQSRCGNLWRNLLKLLVLPIQILKLRRIIKKYPKSIIHAHAMYYILLARFSSRKYIGTPMWSEILVRSYSSPLYRFFARIALSGAAYITVDSEAMKASIADLFALEATVIQNGINIQAINQIKTNQEKRNLVVSIRALTPNYQTDILLSARNRQCPDLPIYFCYPFIEQEYKDRLMSHLIDADQDLGRVSREALYTLLLRSKLAISIPISDSSPRSVYEAIFCGCIVAATKNGWMDKLPQCMISRVFLVDVQSKTWLQDAIHYAALNGDTPYTPSQAALMMFDQYESARRLHKTIYSELARDDSSYGAI